MDVLAPMGGKIIKVSVVVGDQVETDDELAILEAMKMELPLMAEEDGIVAEIKIETGQTVQGKQVIMVLN